MFLFLVILAAIALIVMLRWPSLYTGIIFAVIFVVTIIDIIFLGSETSDKEQEAKTTLKRRLEELISCWESNRGYHLKSILDGSNFQKELRELGNELKEAIGKDKLVERVRELKDKLGVKMDKKGVDDVGGREMSAERKHGCLGNHSGVAGLELRRT